ncbi:MAG: Lysophospholipase and related esterase [Anaerocolumna sp.]|jgi:lysophospholipase L1-like esterase|nr:Lysophospholipase and related esterase [Anaerocolumna sp.]
MYKKEIAENGIISYGNLNRITRAMEKGKKGEDITVAMLGGSITQGSLSSTPKTCYAYHVYEWWVNQFKDSKITYVNAGIGGTTSQFGVARVESDLLKYNADFVIVEYSVNDVENNLFEETYESLVRKILTYPNEPGVLIVNNVQYNDGVNAQRIHNEIGEYYNLPMVSMKNSIYREVEAGKIKKEEITPDDLHPNDVGHKLIGDIINNMLDNIYEKTVEKEIADTYTIPKDTLTNNRYIDSLRLQNKNATFSVNGFHIDQEEQKVITDIFKNGWTGKSVGDSIHFDIEGSLISVQYRKSVKRTAPIAKAVIDNDTENAMILDGNFEETWGDCLYLQDILINGDKGKHTLDITIIQADENSDIDFYLVSVISADRDKRF